MGIRVKAGDTLISIAKRHHVSPTELAKANGIDLEQGQKLQPGWVLKLPLDAAKLPGRGDGFSSGPGRAPSSPQLTGASASEAPAKRPETSTAAPPTAEAGQQGAPATFTTPAGGKSKNGNYKIPPCTFPTFEALDKTRQGLLGPSGKQVYEKLSPEQRACFLNITGAMKSAGIDLTGLLVKDFESDRIFLEPIGLEGLKAQLKGNEGFDYDKPEGKFHPGMTDWGVRQSADLNSLQVGLGPKGGFIDIDRGNPKSSVAGLFTHLTEVLTPGKTNPFAIGKQFGAEQAGYTVRD